MQFPLPDTLPRYSSVHTGFEGPLFPAQLQRLAQEGSKRAWEEGCGVHPILLVLKAEF